MGTSYNSSIVTDGLVLCLDAANPRSYSGAGSTWSDLSGNSLNLTLVNNPTFSEDNAGCIIFDGTNDNAYTSSWSWPSSFSVVFAMYPLSGISTFARIFSTGPTDNFEIAINTSRQISFYASFWRGNIFTLDANTWNHLAFIKQSSNMTIYKNSSQIYTASSVTSTAGSSLYIGRRYNGIEPSNLKMSNVQIYNRGLSADEVRRNYNATRGRYGN